jgi:hypothetical protein
VIELFEKRGSKEEDEDKFGYDRLRLLLIYLLCSNKLQSSDQFCEILMERFENLNNDSFMYLMERKARNKEN